MKFYGTRTREVAERILKAFQEPEALPEALAPLFIHRTDGTPCRNWSWHNQLLVALSGTVDARGIRQWGKVKRTVKKGSKALWILAPCRKTITKKNDQGEEESKSILFGFRAIPVFAIEDTTGDPIEAQTDPYAVWLDELPLIEVAKQWDIQVDAFTHAAGNPLGYYRYADTGQQAIMLGTENLSTWTHELVHAADHRVGGLKEARWHKEIVAELGGAVLLACMGKDQEADLGGAYAYITRHAEHADKHPVKACIEVLDRVCTCVSLILDTAAVSIQPTKPDPVQPHVTVSNATP